MEDTGKRTYTELKRIVSDREKPWRDINHHLTNLRIEKKDRKYVMQQRQVEKRLKGKEHWSGAASISFNLSSTWMRRFRLLEYLHRFRISACSFRYLRRDGWESDFTQHRLNDYWNTRKPLLVRA